MDESVNGNTRSGFSVLEHSVAKWVIALTTVLGFCLAAIGLFLRYRPKFEYEIISKTDFLNSDESFSGLRVYLDSIDIQQTHLNISVFLVKIENKGSSPIRYVDYDEGGFGLRLKDGRLIDPPMIVGASTEHLTIRFQEDVSSNDSTIFIPRLPLDEGDFFTIKTTVLHQESSSPSFSAFGKVSGQKSIQINDVYDANPSLIKSVFKGDFLVQIIRGLLYFLIVCCVLFIIAGLVNIVKDLSRNGKRKQYIMGIWEDSDLDNTVKDDFITFGGVFIEDLHLFYWYGEAEATYKYLKAMSAVSNADSSAEIDLQSVSLKNGKYLIRDLRHYAKKGYISIKEDGTIVFDQKKKESVNYLYDKIGKDPKNNYLWLGHSYRNSILGEYHTP